MKDSWRRYSTGSFLFSCSKAKTFEITQPGRPLGDLKINRLKVSTGQLRVLFLQIESFLDSKYACHNFYCANYFVKDMSKGNVQKPLVNSPKDIKEVHWIEWKAIPQQISVEVDSDLTLWITETSKSPSMLLRLFIKFCHPLLKEKSAILHVKSD